MKNTITYLFNNCKYLFRPLYIIAISTPLIILYSFVKNKACLNIITFLFNTIIIVSIISIIIMIFKYCHNNLRLKIDNYSNQIKPIFVNIIVLSLWTVCLFAFLYIYIMLYSLLSKSFEVQNNLILQLSAPVIYALNNGLPGVILLFIFITEIIFVITIINISCCFSYKNIFSKYKILASVFLSVLTYLIEKKLIIYINNWIIFLMGGPEQVLTAGTSLPKIIILLNELILFILFITINIYFYSIGRKKFIGQVL